MKKLWPVDNRNTGRLIVLGATVGLGHGMIRDFTEAFGPVTGFIVGAAATAALAAALAFLLNIRGKFRQKAE